jgi:acyl-[acyl-carrier-protein]-phospholipid O-acyltransferase/long-chain-fatty-acid--[acyl-carrier-protein] ligase
LIKGPNVMQGYFKMPEQTAKVLRDGWYSTGDMGMLDEDGFIQITGRLSRFSKIGGEMVPHIHIEEILQRILASDDGEDDKPVVAVTAVPDQRKGERLIVLHLPAEKTPDTIVKQLAAEGLPNLWIPSTDSFFEVQQIPLLGTGKLDLQGVKELAQEKLGIISAG